MIKLITYTDDRMTMSAYACASSGMKHGANNARTYTPEDLSQSFKDQVAHILKHERGAGFYCWKPYVIAREMNDLNDGDVLVWSDAGTTWIEDINLLVQAMDQDILLFSNGFPHVEWCKMDCLVEMLGEAPAYIEKPFFINKGLKQVQASHIVFKVNGNTRDFVNQWLNWSIIPGILDNEPSVRPNIPTFAEHRWDQSVLTNLQIMHGYKLHWFPSTYGHHLHEQYPDDKYPAMFEHHRKRNNEW